MIAAFLRLGRPFDEARADMRLTSTRLALTAIRRRRSTCSLRTQQRAEVDVRADSTVQPIVLVVLVCQTQGVGQLVSVPPMSSAPACTSGHGSGRPTCGRQVLLRKEVIQPHLPVRLPCYDFVPIADPTFDGSLPYGLGHRLRVLPTFVT